MKWYTESLSELGGPAEWQQRAKAMLADAVPTMKQNLEEAMAAMNQNAEAGLATLKKAYESATPGTIDQMHARTRELWEHSLGVMRQNAQTTLQMNARLLDAWTMLARNQAPTAPKAD